MDVPAEFWVRGAGLVAGVVNILGFLETSETRMKWVFAISSLFWGVQYHLLGSLSGMLIMLLAAVRQGVSVYTPGMSQFRKIQWASLFSLTATLVMTLTAQVWMYAAVGLVATLIGTWTFFLCGNASVRRWTLVTNSLWAVYAIVFQSWELLICMLVINVANVYGLRRLSAKPSLCAFTP